MHSKISPSGINNLRVAGMKLCRIGNGRLGAMVFGHPTEELIQLNEETLWSGGPVNTDPNPQAPQYLDEIRRALFNQEYQKAEALSKKMQGLFTESYEPLGDLMLKYNLNGEPTDYYRDLNISTAVATTRFKVNGVEYKRELFISQPQQVMIIRLTASQKGALNFDVKRSSPLYFKNKVVSAFGNSDARKGSLTHGSQLHANYGAAGGLQRSYWM